MQRTWAEQTYIGDDCRQPPRQRSTKVQEFNVVNKKYHAQGHGKAPASAQPYVYNKPNGDADGGRYCDGHASWRGCGSTDPRESSNAGIV